MTSDGQRGVNPLLLQTPVTVKSGVTHESVWWWKMCSASLKGVCSHSVAKIGFDISGAVEVHIV